MNNKMIDEFSLRYNANIKMLDSARHDVYYRGYDSYSTGPGLQSPSSQSYYLDPRGRTVEIEMPLRSFEQMVEMNHHAELDCRATRDEALIRRQFPSVAEAYAQYKMLLELCR